MSNKQTSIELLMDKLGLSIETHRKAFEEAKEMHKKEMETLYTKEQVIGFAEWLASDWFPMWVEDRFLWLWDKETQKVPENYKGYKSEKELFDLFQSLKQPKKD